MILKGRIFRDIFVILSLLVSATNLCVSSYLWFEVSAVNYNLNHIPVDQITDFSSCKKQLSQNTHNP